MEHPLTQTLELVHKAQDGDGDAMNRLFQRYYERVRRSVRARIGIRLRERLDSEDILQPAFAKAFENFDRFEMQHEGSLLHWLAEIAERQVRDALDRQNAKKRKAPGGEVSLDADVGGDSDVRRQVSANVTGPVDGAARAERNDVVEECLAELPDHYRMVIVMRNFEGLEWREVAKKLKKNTESAARELHDRALLKLNLLLRRRGIGPEAL